MSDYIELHANSAFSFLRGASLPEELAAQAAKLGLPGLAVLDRDGVYGAPRLYQATRDCGVRPIVGAEITMEDRSVLPLLVMNPQGYRNLSRLISTAKLEPRSPTSNKRTCSFRSTRIPAAMLTRAASRRIT